MAFPLFVLAMGIVAALGNTLANIRVRDGDHQPAVYTRMARAEVNVRREAGLRGGRAAVGTGAAGCWPCTCSPTACADDGAGVAEPRLGHPQTRRTVVHRLGVRPPTPELGLMVAGAARPSSFRRVWIASSPPRADDGVFCSLLGDACAT